MKELAELKCDTCGRVEEIDFMLLGSRKGEKCVNCDGTPMRNIDYIMWLVVVVLIKLGMVKVAKKEDKNVICFDTSDTK